jgi:hypothetical protein
VGADDEISRASDGFWILTANAMATMIYDIPALPGLDIQKLISRGSQSDQRV